METTAPLSTFETPLSTRMTNVELGLVIVSLAASVITIVINPLTLLALFKQRMLTKSSINLFIGSLCCSDFLLGVGAFLFQLQKLLQLSPTAHFEDPTISCMASFIILISFIMSSINVFLISFDRACATLAPIQYKGSASIKWPSIALAIAWASTVLQVAIPMTIKMVQVGQITIVHNPYGLIPYKFRLYWMTPLTYISTATNILLYAVIIFAFFRVVKKVQPSSSISELRSRRMTRMVIMTMGSLLLGTIPIVTVTAFPETPNAPYMWSHQMFYNIAVLCVITPTFCNNFIYVWQLPDFKNAFQRLLSCPIG